MDINEKVDDLIDRGFAYLDDYEYDDAIRVGEELKNLRHSSAFELLALAYEGQGKIEKAIEVLREGLEKAPGVWILWQLLGNYSSDVGEYSEARKCYENALNCTDVNESSVYLNSAIVYRRESRYREALNELEHVTDPEITLRTLPFKIDSLTGLGEYQAAVRTGEEAVSLGWEDELYDVLSDIHASTADAYHKLKDPEKALEHAWKAIEFNKGQSEAAWLIREIENRTSADAKYYRILVDGVWPVPLEGDSGLSGFFTSYHVLADNIDEALAMIKQFEPLPVRDSLKIEEMEVLEERADDPRGIYWADKGYSFYPLDEEGDDTR